MGLLLVWVINAISLLAVAYLIPGIYIASFGSALLAALVLGLLNTLMRPLLIILTLPVTVLTLGLFIFVLNALLFWMAGSLLSGFSVSGFWPAFFGALAYSFISWLLASLVTPSNTRDLA